MKVPTYEYQCGECSHTFERRQHFNEEPVAVCPSCGGKCSRVIHNTPVIFKGSRFASAGPNRKPGQVPGWTEGTEENLPPREKTLEIMKADALTRQMVKDAGVG